MTRPTLHEARTYAALATLTGLTASAGVGAGAHLTAGPAAGLATGLLAAAATVGGALALLRLRITDPRG